MVEVLLLIDGRVHRNKRLAHCHGLLVDRILIVKIGHRHRRIIAAVVIARRRSGNVSSVVKAHFGWTHSTQTRYH